MDRDQIINEIARMKEGLLRLSDASRAAKINDGEWHRLDVHIEVAHAAMHEAWKMLRVSADVDAAAQASMPA